VSAPAPARTRTRTCIRTRTRTRTQGWSDQEVRRSEPVPKLRSAKQGRRTEEPHGAEDGTYVTTSDPLTQPPLCLSSYAAFLGAATILGPDRAPPRRFRCRSSVESNIVVGRRKIHRPAFLTVRKVRDRIYRSAKVGPPSLGNDRDKYNALRVTHSANAPQ